jgi:hypothetical protein
MTRKRSFGLVVLVSLTLASTLTAQFDATQFAKNLRAKYALTIATGPFTTEATPGIDMTVVFAANDQVCRIRLQPNQAGRTRRVMAGRSVDRFIDQLVPPAIRGKGLQRFSEAIGLPSKSTIQYENVTISEFFQGQERTEVTVTFPQEVCPAP